MQYPLIDSGQKNYQPVSGITSSDHPIKPIAFPPFFSLDAGLHSAKPILLLLFLLLQTIGTLLLFPP